MIIILNSFLGESFIFISLTSVSGVLSYYFVWNIFLCYFIFLDFVLLFIHNIRHNSYLFQPDRVSAVGDNPFFSA